METTFASRLIAARKMAGLSLQRLADKLGNVVTKQALSKYEQGKMKPDSELVIAISNILNVSANYFYIKPALEINFTNIDFRKTSSRLNSTEEESVKERAKDAFERHLELENIIKLPDNNYYFNYSDEIENIHDAENAAIKLREDWQLGNDPIPDVIGMLEEKGYKIAEIEAPEAFDGFKANIGDMKAIVLRRTQPEDDIVRKRFTALHELAHHSLKFSEKLSEKEKERLCHAFASAVLYPAEMARKEMHKERFHFYENELRLIKEKWGISFSATFSRALQLNIINQNVYKKFNIGYRSRKYHEPNKEPGRFPGKERLVKPERLVYIGLAKEILTLNEAAYFAGKSSWELKSQLNQLV
jgi:Zn-dependent peptidase ImmA (M78 family)/DNA-binding XRE family transcriptional regulator